MILAAPFLNSNHDSFLISMSGKDDSSSNDNSAFFPAGYRSFLDSQNVSMDVSSDHSMHFPIQPMQSSADERLAVTNAVSAAQDLLGAGKRRRSASSKKKPVASSNMKLPFPWKLYQLLEDMELQGASHIVSWLKDGKSFRVHDPKAFQEHIMQRYFRMSKFQSFTRQLYIYGFSKIEGGTAHGAFWHKDFLKGQKDLCMAIGRNKGPDRRLKSAVSRKVQEMMYENSKSDEDASQTDVVASSASVLRTRSRSALLQDSCSDVVGAASAISSSLELTESKHSALHAGDEEDDGEDWLSNPLGLEPMEPVPPVASSSSTTAANQEPEDAMDLSALLEPRTIEEMRGGPLPPPPPLPRPSPSSP